MKIVNYHATIGLNVYIKKLNKRALVRIAHDKLDNGTWKVYVESGNNLAVIKKCRTKILTNEEIQPLFNITDDVQEFRNLAGLFGITL